MDAHARSLLERLNTSSPKSIFKVSITAKEEIASTDPLEPNDSGKTVPEAVISPGTQRSASANIEQPDASTPVKDLLVAARHRQRSRETSACSSSHSTDDTYPTEVGSPGTVTLKGGSQIHPVSAKDDLHGVSDADSTANPEGIPTSPSGSTRSSLLSNATDKSRDASNSVQYSNPCGHRIIHDVPSVVTLSPMGVLVPGLQILTDVGGRTIPGDRIRQIANLQRTFGHHDRDIIGATTKYIVYALKGTALIELF